MLTHHKVAEHSLPPSLPTDSRRTATSKINPSSNYLLSGPRASDNFCNQLASHSPSTDTCTRPEISSTHPFLPACQESTFFLRGEVARRLEVVVYYCTRFIKSPNLIGSKSPHSQLTRANRVLLQPPGLWGRKSNAINAKGGSYPWPPSFNFASL